MILLAVVVATLAPHDAAAGTDATLSPIDPLVVTRTVHALSLRFAGATITHHADDRLQRTHNDCALAVVEQLHTRTQRPLPSRSWLAHTLQLSPQGVAITPLAATLTLLGWSALVTRDPTRHIAALRLPAVTLMYPGHYVLLTARSATHAHYFDPLVGQVHQPLPQFAARWTGNSVQLSVPDR